MSALALRQVSPLISFPSLQIQLSTPISMRSSTLPWPSIPNGLEMTSATGFLVFLVEESHVIENRDHQQIGPKLISLYKVL